MSGDDFNRKRFDKPFQGIGPWRFDNLSLEILAAMVYHSPHDPKIQKDLPGGGCPHWFDKPL
jgi:hypothetical protein